MESNAAEDPKVEGMEVFYFPGATAGKKAASQVLGSMQTAFPNHRRRGVKSANFAVLRLTDMPAILVEMEFITHPRQLEFLTDPGNQFALAAAIATGIDLLSGY